ncbi:MAG TPA: aminoglycoside phosphotransferase family protein [Chloroflexota bacterium]|nr:aminoglycoside phosphotransferase family protein [Chloroflexota bacterium]
MTSELMGTTLPRLIDETLRRHVIGDAQVVAISSEPIEPGLSGATVARHSVTFDSQGVRRTVSLVTKEASLIERRILALLQEQGQPGIPFNHSLTLTEAVAPLCLEDLGDVRRPTSLDPISPELIRREASALAGIHHDNASIDPKEFSLPRVDSRYVREHLARLWEPAWQRAVDNVAFRGEFGDAIDAVEAATRQIPDAVEDLAADGRDLTLLHGDLNPGNVLISGGSPYFVDWQAACYGPFYLDLPHHLHTLTAATAYLHARERLGDRIDPQDFAAKFRMAAHYIGLRYIWWTLDLWAEDPADARWVRHYLDLITL